MTEKLQQAQIQITPVDDGYIIQAQSIDGVRKNARQIATTLEILKEKVHKLVDQLYEPVPATPTVELEKDSPSGPAGTQSPT